MKKFTRPVEPIFWKENFYKKKNINFKEVKSILSDFTQSHCSYCDVLLDTDNSQIDNFLPKSKFPENANDWDNLYLCCSVCNRNKGAILDIYLLKPDDNDYFFEKYFICDFETGAIKPNPAASQTEEKQAIRTINVLNLNRKQLLQSRLSEYNRFKQILYVVKTNAELKGEQFDYTKYGDILDIDKYSYRFFLEQAFSELKSTKKTNEIQSVEHYDKEFEQIRIKNISIKNIKGFSDISINFNTKNQTNLILGINGRGKTTILQLIAVVLQQLDSKVLSKKWNQIVKKGKTEGFFSLQFENHNELELKINVTENDDIVFVSGMDTYQKIKDDLLILAYGSYRRTSERYDNEKDNYQCVSSLFGDNYLKNIKTPGVANYLKNNFNYIKDLINKIFKTAEIESQVLLDSFDDYSFYFTTPTNKADKISFDALAEGYKAVFVWLIDMIIRIVERGYTIFSTEKINGIIMIDEIDLHLHPAWQRTFMPTLNSIFPNIQFIITSHSPFVIQSLSISDVIMLILYRNEIKTKKIEKDGKFNTYKIDEIIEKILSAETGDLMVNDWLSNKLDLLEKAVEDNKRDELSTIAKELRNNLPKNSGFHDFIDIMTAGLIK